MSRRAVVTSPSVFKENEMNYKEFNVDLQIKENHIDIIRGIEQCTVEQFDGANKFNIRLMDGSDPFDFSDYTDIEVFIKKPDETFLSYSVGERLQVVDPENGQISFLLSGQAVVVSGMHFMTIRVYDETTVLSTARLNYYVYEANASWATEEELQSIPEWDSIMQVLARGAEMVVAEQARALAERARELAEAERTSTIAGVVATATQLSAQAQAYAEQAQMWSEAAQRIALGEETIEDIIVTPESLEDRLSVLDGNDDTIQIRRGLAENLPTLAPGELYFCTDTNQIYIGSALGNIEVNKRQWVADAEEPVDTDLLWIDTENDNSLKFYVPGDGEGGEDGEWVSTAHLTFA